MLTKIGRCNDIKKDPLKRNLNTYSLHAKFPDYQVFNGTQGIRFVFFKLNYFFLHQQLGLNLFGKINKGPHYDFF